tara:strand:+ start:11 stop:511 length:501 start_codon:yes stop_codon:yes gene_type:complete
MTGKRIPKNFIATMEYKNSWKEKINKYFADTRKEMEQIIYEYIFKNKIDKNVYSKLGTLELLELHKAITLFLQTDEKLLPTIKKAFDTTCDNIIEDIKKNIEFNNTLYGDLISYTRYLSRQYIWKTRFRCNKNFKHFNPQSELLIDYLNDDLFNTLYDKLNWSLEK